MSDAKIFFADNAQMFKKENEPEKHNFYMGLFALSEDIERVEEHLSEIEKRLGKIEGMLGD